MHTLIEPCILMRWLKKIKQWGIKLLRRYHLPFPAQELFAGKIN